MNKAFRRLLVMGAFLALGGTAFAGQIGHYNPNVLNLRDLVVAPKGFYFGVYNPYYSTNGFYSHNEKVETIQTARTIQLPNGGAIDFTATANVDLSVQSAGSTQIFLWSTGKQFLGADYQVIVAPYEGYQRVKLEADASIPGIILPGDLARVSVEKEDTASGFGDLYVQPMTLGWHLPRWDFSLYYGFYAPTGGYNKNDLANIGYGFWSHELNFATYYYVTPDKATALLLDVNYEFNTKKEGSDVTPGQNVALTYGISQYLSEQLEVSAFGTSIYKVRGDTGSDVSNKKASDYVNAVGGQLGYWVIKNRLNLSLMYTSEYAASGRTRGDLATINVLYAF